MSDPNYVVNSVSSSVPTFPHVIRDVTCEVIKDGEMWEEVDYPHKLNKLSNVSSNANCFLTRPVRFGLDSM